MNNFLKNTLMLLSFIFAASSHANKGLGIVLGQPTGLSGRIDTHSTTAWDAAMAWNLGKSSYLLVQADRLWVRPKAFKLDTTALDFYYGVGAIVSIPHSDLALAFRIPAGLSYRFRDPSLEIFGELAIAFTLVPSTDFDVLGGVGLRYWFD